MSRALLQRAFEELEDLHKNHGITCAGLLSDLKSELAKPEPDPIGQILDDKAYHSVSFDKRIGRAIWFKSLNDFHDGASLYTSPPQ